MRLIPEKHSVDKKSRKRLVITLITVEVIGILALIWYLREPLIKKYLIPSPKVYSLESMSPEKRYLLSPLDYVTSDSKANENIKLMLINKEKKFVYKFISDSQGSWIFQIPEDTKPGIYLLVTATKQNSGGKYDLKIKRIKVYDNRKLFFGIPSSVFAQDDLNPVYNNEEYLEITAPAVDCPECLSEPPLIPQTDNEDSDDEDLYKVIFPEVNYGKGCLNQKCSQQSDAVPVPLEKFYSFEEYFAQDGSPLNLYTECGQDCPWPKYQIPKIYVQHRNQVQEALNNPDLQCNADPQHPDSVQKSTCAPSALAMLTESFWGVKQDLGNQIANEFSRFLFESRLMDCRSGLLDDKLVEAIEVSPSALKELFWVSIDRLHDSKLKFSSPLADNLGEYNYLENWYHTTLYPTWTATKYGGTDPHYVTLAAITPNYVWVADPYEFGELNTGEDQYLLRFDKQVFINKYYRNKYWEINPLSDPVTPPLPGWYNPNWSNPTFGVE
jgi:hypothetical protein